MAEANLTARITALQDLIVNLTTEIAAKPDDTHLSKALTDAQAELTILEAEAGGAAAASPAPVPTEEAKIEGEIADLAAKVTAGDPNAVAVTAELKAKLAALQAPPASTAAPAASAAPAPAAAPAAQPPAAAAPRPRPQLSIVPTPPAGRPEPKSAPTPHPAATITTSAGVHAGGPSWQYKYPHMVPGNVKA